MKVTACKLILRHYFTIGKDVLKVPLLLVDLLKSCLLSDGNIKISHQVIIIKFTHD